jgi:hypothetical protein
MCSRYTRSARGQARVPAADLSTPLPLVDSRWARKPPAMPALRYPVRVWGQPSTGVGFHHECNVHAERNFPEYHFSLSPFPVSTFLPPAKPIPCYAPGPRKSMRKEQGRRKSPKRRGSSMRGG